MKNDTACFYCIINNTLNNLSLTGLKNAVLDLHVPLPSSGVSIRCPRKHKVVRRKELICSCLHCLGASKFGKSPFAVLLGSISMK